jgi:Tfp pilus assembly protein PilZ
MAQAQRRKWDRKETLNLVDYVILGEDGVFLRRGMGRTRNVSEGGLFLETHRPLKEGEEVLITLGLKDDMVRLRGRVVRQARPTDEYRHCAGVKFTHIHKDDKETLKSYIGALNPSATTEKPTALDLTNMS